MKLLLKITENAIYIVLLVLVYFLYLYYATGYEIRYVLFGLLLSFLSLILFAICADNRLKSEADIDEKSQSIVNVLLIMAGVALIFDLGRYVWIYRSEVFTFIQSYIQSHLFLSLLIVVLIALILAAVGNFGRIFVFVNKRKELDFVLQHSETCPDSRLWKAYLYFPQNAKIQDILRKNLSIEFALEKYRESEGYHHFLLKLLRDRISSMTYLDWYENKKNFEPYLLLIDSLLDDLNKKLISAEARELRLEVLDLIIETSLKVETEIDDERLHVFFNRGSYYGKIFETRQPQKWLRKFEIFDHQRFENIGLLIKALQNWNERLKNEEHLNQEEQAKEREQRKNDVATKLQKEIDLDLYTICRNDINKNLLEAAGHTANYKLFDGIYKPQIDKFDFNPNRVRKFVTQLDEVYKLENLNNLEVEGIKIIVSSLLKEIFSLDPFDGVVSYARELIKSLRTTLHPNLLKELHQYLIDKLGDEYGKYNKALRTDLLLIKPKGGEQLKLAQQLVDNVIEENMSDYNLNDVLSEYDIKLVQKKS